MIRHVPHVVLRGFEIIRQEGAEVLAIALVDVDGVAVEPMTVTVNEKGDVGVHCEGVLDGWLVLRTLFGGAPFQSLPEPAREWINRQVAARMIDAFQEGGE